MITCDNQVAKDSQLLDTARDCFYFVTKLFEPISVSATHIYHSALELCPVSSIVRKLYYDRCHGLTRFPRVVIGTPHLWDTAISISCKHGYGFCTWSPCGQFIAAQTGQTVEIRNHLNFELLIILKSTEHIPPTSPIAYSPDGRSIACGFSGGIVVWDIQTGGVSKEIRRGEDTLASLAWSLDGNMVAVTLCNWSSVTDVETYNVFSGVQLFAKRFHSYDEERYIYLWAHEKSFRFIEAVPAKVCLNNRSFAYTISEIGPTLIEIESSSLMVALPYSSYISEITFSPSTYHIAIWGGNISVHDIHSSHPLFQNLRSGCSSFQFSADGSHCACFRKNGLHVFRCTSGHYTLLSKYLLKHQHKTCLQFSPTSSSILSQHNGILQVRRLIDLPIASEIRDQYTVVSRSGRSIATAHRPVDGSKATISIIDLHSRASPQFIDTCFYVTKLAITGNVLVAMGHGRAAGWLLTEEGKLDGVFDNRRAGDSDSKWALASRTDHLWNVEVEGKVGVIRKYDLRGKCYKSLFYHIETGDVFNPAPELRHSSPKPSPEISTEGGSHRHPRNPTLSYNPL